MDYFDYDFDDYEDDSNYGQIIQYSNPSLVDCVSMLRHFINCHGITKGLKKYLNITRDEIDMLSELRGSTPLHKDMSKEIDGLIENAREEHLKRVDAEIKNQQLIHILSNKRKNMCGIGTRKVKLFLNKQIKLGDKNAELYRKILEIEDVNIQAKETSYYYQDKVYREKEALLKELVELCQQNNVTFGYQHANNYSTFYLLYFELPDLQQISFHCNLPKDYIEKLPKYEKDWDGLVNSTLDKIEQTLNNKYFNK